MNVTHSTNFNKTYNKPFYGMNNEIPIKSTINQILKKEDLKAMLFKAKKYYNDLNTIKNEKEANVIFLKEKSETNDTKIRQMKAVKNIELKSENISVREMTNLRETKEQIQSKIETLIHEKKDLEEKFKTESEYTNILSHLITTEKNNLENLNEKLIKTHDKIMAIKVAKKNLDANVEENTKRNKVYKNVIKELEDEIVNLEKLKKYQQSELDNITESLESRERLLNDKRILIENITFDKETELRQEKEKVLKEIKRTEELKLIKQNKEKEYIKLVLGLDIIKKYYIDLDKMGKEINNSILIKSEDYKTFTSEKYNIYDENSDIIYHTNSNNNSSDDIIPIVSNVSSPRSLRKIQSDRNGMRINLKDLKEKFDNLDLDYETLYNFYTKIITKTAFYHTNMMNLNLKIINLESKKEHFTSKVRNIMRNDYKNFDDLIKNNSRFENFMRSFQDELKNKREVEMNVALLKDLNNYFTNGFDFPPSEYSDFYKKCLDILSVVKAYYEVLQFNFKNMIKDFPVLFNSNRSEIKPIEDIVKKVNKLIIDYVSDNFTEKNTKSKEDYVNEILTIAESELKPEIISKMESSFNFNLKELKHFILPNDNEKNKKNFFKLNLSMEQLILNYLNNVNKTQEIAKSLLELAETCNNLGININMSKSSLNVLKKHSTISNDDETEKVLSFWDRQNEQKTQISTQYIKNSKIDESQITNALMNNSYISGNELGESQNNSMIRVNNIFNKKKSSHNNSVHKLETNSNNVNSVLLPNMSKVNLNPLAKSSTNFNINQKIITKLYMPIIEKRMFNIKINENISEIKKNTRKNSTMTHYLNKKKKEIDKIGNELIIYNNPSNNII